MIQKEYSFDKNELNEEVPIHQLLGIDLAFLKDKYVYGTTKNQEVIDVLFSYGSTWDNYGNILYKTINLFLEELHELSKEPFSHYKLYQLVTQIIESYLNYLLAHDQKHLESFLDPKIIDLNTKFLSYLGIRHYFFAKKGIKESFSEKYPDLINLAKESYLKAKDLIAGNASIAFEKKLILLLDDRISQEQKDIIHEELIQLASNNSILDGYITIDKKYFTKDIDRKINLEQYLNHILLQDINIIDFTNTNTSTTYKINVHTEFLEYLVKEFQRSAEKENYHLLNQRIVNFLNLCFLYGNYYTWNINNLDLRNLDLSNLQNSINIHFHNPIVNENTIIDPLSLLNQKITVDSPKFHITDKTILKEIKDESEKYGQISSLNQYLEKNDNNVYIESSDLYYPSEEDIKDFPYKKDITNLPQDKIKISHVFYKNILQKSIGGKRFLTLLYLNSYLNPDRTLDHFGYVESEASSLILEHSYLFKAYETKDFIDNMLKDLLIERKSSKIEIDQLKQQIEELTVQNQQLLESLQALEPKGTKRKTLEGKEEVNPNENHLESLGAHTKRLKLLKDSSDISKGPLKWL